MSAQVNICVLVRVRTQPCWRRRLQRMLGRKANVDAIDELSCIR